MRAHIRDGIKLPGDVEQSDGQVINIHKKTFAVAQFFYSGDSHKFALIFIQLIIVIQNPTPMSAFFLYQIVAGFTQTIDASFEHF